MVIEKTSACGYELSGRVHAHVYMPGLNVCV